MAKKQPEPPRDLAHLQAFDATGKVVLQRRINLGRYYEGDHPLIDEGEFRAARGIVRVTGRLYGLDGKLEEEFENTYEASGALIDSNAKTY